MMIQRRRLLLALLGILLLFGCSQEKLKDDKEESLEKQNPFSLSEIAHVCLDTRNNLAITFIYDNWQHDFSEFDGYSSNTMYYYALDQKQHPNLAIYYYRERLQQNLTDYKQLHTFVMEELKAEFDYWFQTDELYCAIEELDANGYPALSLGYRLCGGDWGAYCLIFRYYLVSTGDTIVFFQTTSTDKDSENLDKVVKSMLATIKIDEFEQ